MRDHTKTPEEMRAETENIKARVNSEIDKLRDDPNPAATHEAAEQVVQEHVRKLQAEYRERVRNARGPVAKAVTGSNAWVGVGIGLIAAGILVGYLMHRNEMDRDEMHHNGRPAGDEPVVQTERYVAVYTTLP